MSPADPGCIHSSAGDGSGQPVFRRGVTPAEPAVIDWYRELLANTMWNFHELPGLTIQPTVSGFTVGFDVDWQGAVSDGSGWPSNLEAGRFRFALRQDWQVAVRSGPAAANLFEIHRSRRKTALIGALDSTLTRRRVAYARALSRMLKQSWTHLPLRLNLTP